MKVFSFSWFSWFFTLALLLGTAPIHVSSQSLSQENQQIAQTSNWLLSLYDLKPGERMREITEDILSHPQVKAEVKQSIQDYRRHIFVFSYPSDGLMIKGFISLTAHSKHQPLLVLFRSGNRGFALPNPGGELANYKGYTVISSTLRGGVSEGKDEFGGKDVDDMKNLLDFLPTLSQWLGVEIQSKPLYFIGPSRGGMEMFLTLARFPELQKKVDKVVGLSALLDLSTQIKNRPDDMKAMFIQDFGLMEGVNEQEWISERDPLLTAPLLPPCLPILIIQGTKDNRVSLAEGYHMVQTLEKNGKKADYWEIEGGEHTLYNVPHLMDQVAQWLEAPQMTC